MKPQRGVFCLEPQPQALGAGVSAEPGLCPAQVPPTPQPWAQPVAALGHGRPWCLACGLGGVCGQWEPLSFLQQLSKGMLPPPAAAPEQCEEKRRVGVAGRMGWGSSAHLAVAHLRLSPTRDSPHTAPGVQEG